ncbi:thioesterase II family protein [Saccharomonospora azurea]|uniref:thioesterase II family protein n=1 Tax=Saccharomonospora azurea TaxID=40988 RepID=UPI0024090E63|nr:alpha/beta fold hydrolase [Saccharomonospora azurea]
MTTTVDSSAWIRCFHPRPTAAHRVVVFPHAGGSASFYRPMSAALGEAEVLNVQYPGRQDRRSEPCISDLGVLADQVFTALRPALDDDVVFFGHSMGALVAFEVALRMREQSLSPRLLFASGRRAPSRYRDEAVHRRDDDGIIAEMKRLSGTDARVLGDEELVRMILPAIRGDYTAVETYRCHPQAVVDCPIEVLTGDADPVTSADEAQAWREHTSRNCTVHTYRGGHFFLVDHQREVVKLIQDGLAGTRS